MNCGNFNDTLLQFQPKPRYRDIDDFRNLWTASIAMLIFAVLTSPAFAGPPACPKSMSASVEAVLLPILDATSDALRTDDWFNKSYEARLDKLLAGKDDVSVEARVALMDYPVATAYAEQLSCVVSTGGKKARYYLELYSRCDIAPSKSPVLRDHARQLRSLTMKAWEAGNGKGSCDSE